MTDENIIRVLCSVLVFDDGNCSVMPLHRGTREECEKVAAMIPAVCNSTGKRCVSSSMIMPTVEEFEAAISDQTDEEANHAE